MIYLRLRSRPVRGRHRPDLADPAAAPAAAVAAVVVPAAAADDGAALAELGHGYRGAVAWNKRIVSIQSISLLMILQH